MNSEQIREQVDKYLAGGGRIQKLQEDNRRYFFPVFEEEKNLLDQFALNLFEEDERFFDILD